MGVYLSACPWWFYPGWICAKLSSLATVWSGVSTEGASYLLLACAKSLIVCNISLIWSFQNVVLSRPACPQALPPLHHLRAPTVSTQGFSLEENMSWHRLSWTKSQYRNDDCMSSVSKSSVLWKQTTMDFWLRQSCDAPGLESWI